ncbi:MAG: hypothetical protein IJN75_02490 [Clostridia bacterium]|nr:hypothetical protein [Clostridia bacterium]
MDDKNVQNDGLITSEPTVDEIPTVEEAPVAAEAPEAEDIPATEESPEAEDIPATEEAPEAEDIPATEETPEAEDIPATEETPQMAAAEVIDATVMPKTEFVGYTPEPTATTVTKEKKNNGLAIASMVCGIVGAVFAIFGLCGLCCCWPLTIPASICAVVFAFVDRSKKKAFNGMTIAGLICGIIGIVTPFAFLVFDYIINYDGDFSKLQEEFWEEFYKNYNEFE